MNANFKKLIEGEISLKKAFWLYGNIYPFFISLIIIITIIYFQENIKESILKKVFFDISLFGKVIIIIQGIIFFTYVSFATLGIWRCANNYKGKKIWIYLAKIAILYAYYSYIKNALFLYENSNLIL